MQPETPAWFRAPAGDEAIPVLSGEDVAVGEQRERFPRIDADPWFRRMTITIGGEAWQLQKFLGSGAWGQVYQALHEPTGVHYVMKFLRDDEDKEVAFLRGVPARVWRHRHLVTYFGIIEKVDAVPGLRPACHIVVMEFVPNGELFDLVTGPDGRATSALSQGMMRRLLHDLIDGLHALSENGIAHRDMKPENFFLGNGRLVIGDLGHSKRKHEADEWAAPGPTDGETVQVGTPHYWAPEKRNMHAKGLVKSTYDSERSDVFTLGIVAFQMTQPTLPFGPQLGGCSKIKDEGPDAAWWGRFPNFQDPEDPREELKEMLGTLWRRAPERRPDFRQLHRAKFGDKEVLDKFPALRWLAVEPCTPQEFVAEVRRRRPGFAVQSEALAKALRDLVRAGCEQAYGSANRSEDGQLTAEQLAEALAADPVEVAGMMAPHMEGQGMTLAEFAKMAGPSSMQSDAMPGVDRRTSGRRPRYEAFAPREGESSEAFLAQVRGACAAARFTVAANPDDPEVCHVAMQAQECRLRLTVRATEGVLVLESVRANGTALDEMTMLQTIVEGLEKKGEARAVLPERFQRPDNVGSLSGAS